MKLARAIRAFFQKGPAVVELVLVAVFLALPWFDYLPIDPPAALFFGCFLLNASLLFVLGLLLSCAAAGLRRR